LGGEKMSKSLGNLVTIDDFLAAHDADVFRFIVLNSSYRGPLTYTEDVVEQAERGLERLHSALRPALPGAKGAPALESLEKQVQSAREGFISAMDDDFNSAGALGNLFDLVRAVNQARSDGATDAELRPAQALMRELTGVLGLRMHQPGEQSQAAGGFIDLLLEVRGEIRKQKLWALSDLIRDRLKALGVVIEDSREGSSWRYEK
jgi:cysteinyl-tRNA synthetase